MVSDDDDALGEKLRTAKPNIGTVSASNKRIGQELNTEKINLLKPSSFFTYHKV